VDSANLLAGSYALEHIAGHGGMAVVYEGFDTVLERRVAIKYFQTHLLHEPVLVERFRRVALAAAKIVHPNVVAHALGFVRRSSRCWRARRRNPCRESRAAILIRH
jgi:serine/threonine protein kinase